MARELEQCAGREEYGRGMRQMSRVILVHANETRRLSKSLLVDAT